MPMPPTLGAGSWRREAHWLVGQLVLSHQRAPGSVRDPILKNEVRAIWKEPPPSTSGLSTCTHATVMDDNDSCPHIIEFQSQLTAMDLGVYMKQQGL